MSKHYLILVFLFISSVFDAILTDYSICGGKITEANPIMDWLYSFSPNLFLLLKLILPLLLLPLLIKLISKPIKHLLIASCAIYVLVLGLHSVRLLDTFTSI